MTGSVTGVGGKPIARCPANEVEAFSFPFLIAPGKGVGPDFLLLEVHLWEMTAEEKRGLGALVEVRDASQLEEMGFPRDEEGVFIIQRDTMGE